METKLKCTYEMYPDGNIESITVVEDNEKNDITLIQDVGDRIYDVEYDTIQSYVSSVESELKH